jgi:hypothetical protein
MIKILCKLLQKLTVKGTIIYDHNGKLEKIKW